MGAATTDHLEESISGCRIALVGKLASMSRREAEQLIRRRGGSPAASVDGRTNWIVVGDDAADVRREAVESGQVDEAVRAAIDDGRIEVLRESELWTRLGLIEAGPGVARLYTPAMLAELLQVPVATIRHWQRKGHVRAAREVRRLAYFDFDEVHIARKLADLLAAGCSRSSIDRKLDELGRLLPDEPRPLAAGSVVVEGRCLLIRHGESLSEPNGQRLIDFSEEPELPGGRPVEGEPVSLPFAAPDAISIEDLTAEQQAGLSPFELRSMAAQFEEYAEWNQAIEVYRTILMSGDATAEDHFSLAELLYRAGDLAGARERYYVTIELDEDYVEARANLGCVLAEQEEFELAEAAFRGALACHLDYADAHFHLARLLDRMGRGDEAARQWQEFLDLAPISPWAEEARDRVPRTQPE